MAETLINAALNALNEFKIREVDFKRPSVADTAATNQPPTDLPAPLGPLTAFAGAWAGKGFNSIFRPNSTSSPTVFKPPLAEPSTNVLELNLTEETITFSPGLGQIPNRGSGGQADIIMNGIPYIQKVNDVTPTAKGVQPNGIHFEPGIWLEVPKTDTPDDPVTIARMASIPHGTTVVAQGTMIADVAGPPVILPIDMTPFKPGQPTSKKMFDSQVAAKLGTARLPQDLTQLIAKGLITQTLLDNPNQLLNDHLVGQNIMQTIVIGISTNPAHPLSEGPLPPSTAVLPPAIIPSIAGGTANIAFLQGLAQPPADANGPNAFAAQMDALFWIETILYEVDVPDLAAGMPPVVLQPKKVNDSTPMPSFVAAVPFTQGKTFKAATIHVPALQIQYSQKVLLNFAGLSWPHISVATLVPSDPVTIPSALLPMT